MTNEEAIYILEHLTMNGVAGKSYFEIGQAINMAIDALKGTGVHTVNNCVHSVQKDVNCYYCTAKLGANVSNIDCSNCALWRSRK